MAKRKISEEERLKRSERMKAMHAARKAAAEAQKQTEEEIIEAVATETLDTKTETPKSEPVSVGGVTLTNEQFEMLMNRFMGMSNDVKTPDTSITERFSVNPADYRNPVEDLYNIPQLARFGMKHNYVIDWKVTPVKYETRQGQWFMEPKFELTLKRKQFDDSGEEIVKVGKDGKSFHPRIILGRASFFMDPPADILEAELAGLSTHDLNDEDFKYKMMLYRYSTWVIERLIPPRPSEHTNGMKEEVIGGRVYQIEEYSNPV